LIQNLNFNLSYCEFYLFVFVLLKVCVFSLKEKLFNKDYYEIISHRLASQYE